MAQSTPIDPAILNWRRPTIANLLNSPSPEDTTMLTAKANINIGTDTRMKPVKATLAPPPASEPAPPSSASTSTELGEIELTTPRPEPTLSPSPSLVILSPEMYGTGAQSPSPILIIPSPEMYETASPTLIIPSPEMYEPASPTLIILSPETYGAGEDADTDAQSNSTGTVTDRTEIARSATAVGPTIISPRPLPRAWMNRVSRFELMCTD